MPIFYALAILALAINILLSLPKILDLAQSSVASASTTYDPDSSSVGKEVAGVQNPRYPQNRNILIPPLTASAVLVKDIDLDYTLLVKDPDKRVPIASTTKIMTALVAVDYFKPEDILTVPNINLGVGSTMDLKFKEKISFNDLLYGMLLNSGNDAAFAIAYNYPGGVAGFVQAMNDKAQHLGLVNTHFENPAGFDHNEHFSSAFDLARIAAESTKSRYISEVVRTQKKVARSIDNVYAHDLANLNKLLGLPGVMGIKTGFTPQAKENLVTLVDRDGHRILIVVLGSDDRFGETQKLIDWAYSNFIWD